MLLKHLELEAGEEILHTIHKHWYIMLLGAIQQLVVAIMPIVVWFIVLFALNTYAPTVPNAALYHLPYIIFFESCWLLFVLMVAAHNFTLIYLDVWIITDRRIITVDQVTFFRRHLASFRLERLQDITIDINGFLATFLDYGTLEAQTASESGEEFRSKFIPHPEEVKAAILKAADVRLAAARGTETPAL